MNKDIKINNEDVNVKVYDFDPKQESEEVDKDQIARSQEEESDNKEIVNKKDADEEKASFDDVPISYDEPESLYESNEDESSDLHNEELKEEKVDNKDSASIINNNFTDKESTISKEESNENNKEKEEKEEGSSKDHILLYAILFIVIVTAFIIFIPKLIPDQSKLTLEQLHELNLKGKLPKSEGYIYAGAYSFVKSDGLWYTQLTSVSGENLFNIPFHYGPRDVEDIITLGQLNLSNLDRWPNFFMTFDPEDENLNYIAVSTGEVVRPFIEAFGKGVIGSCTKNVTSACESRPIVNCNSTDAPVFYFASENETTLLYLNNCVIMSGKEKELLKAADRMLFDMLGIMASDK